MRPVARFVTASITAFLAWQGFIWLQSHPIDVSRYYNSADTVYFGTATTILIVGCLGTFAFCLGWAADALAEIMEGYSPPPKKPKGMK